MSNLKMKNIFLSDSSGFNFEVAPFVRSFFEGTFDERIHTLMTNAQISASLFYSAYMKLKEDSGKCPIEFIEHCLDLGVIEIISYSIVYGFTDILAECLQCEKHRESIDKSIDKFIDIAIENERHECAVVLLDYKSKHNLYSEPDWSL